jgi:TonB family protein
MRLLRLAAAACIACLVLPSAANAEPVVLEPQSEWGLDSDEDSCALVRVFDDGDEVIQLELRQFAPGGAMRVQITSTSRLISNRDHMSYRFDPAPDWREKDKAVFVYFRAPGKYQGAVFDATVVPPASDGKDLIPERPNDPAYLARLGAALNAANGLSVSGIFADDLTLHTGSLMQPFVALRQCLTKRIEQWGLDPFVQSTLTKLPFPLNQADVVRAVQQNYPARQLNAGVPAILQVRLMVDASGETTDCRVYGPLSDKAFHREACKNLRTTRFDPALDAKGQPVASFWETRIYYRAD